MGYKYILSTFLFILFSDFISAQDIDKERTIETAKDTIRAKKDTLGIDSLSISYNLDELDLYKRSCLMFQDSLEKRDIQVSTLLDSLKLLKSRLAIANMTIRNFENDILKNDTIKIKLANCRLKEKFNEITNNEAIAYLAGIKTESIISGFLYNEIYSLTKRYKRDYMDIINILKEAQNSRNRTNPFYSDFVSEITQQLKGTSYYRELYSKDWKIPYLNNLIDNVLYELSKHNVDKERYADFNKLID